MTVCACGLIAVPNGMAQSNEAEQLRQARENEERYNTMVGRMEELMSANALLQKRVNDLNAQVSSQRGAIEDDRKQFATALSKTVSRDELKAVVEKLQEIDRKREEDKKLITGEIKKMTDELSKPIPAPVVKTPPPVTTPEPVEDANQEYFRHKVEKGEMLSTILAAYNTALKEKGKPPVKMDAVLKANPGLNPKSLRVGKEILIPVPGESKKK